MKVIQIYPYYPPHLGGAEQRVRDLSENLAKKKIDVEVFTSNIDCNKNDIKFRKNLKINCLNAIEFAHTPIIPSLFFKLLKIPKDSIMHVHIAQALTPEIVWLISKIRKIPYVAHIRMDVQPSSKFGCLLGIYKKIFLKKILKDADKIIVLNSDYEILIRKKYNIEKNKISIIPNATIFKQINKKQFSKNNIKLLAVGRLGVQKNLHALIKSITLLSKKFQKQISLRIVGDGSQYEELQKLIIGLKLKNIIKLCGRITGKRLEKEFEKSDIFLLVSHGEGFSTTLIEAMSKGLPIITSNIIGNRCIIKNNYNGYLVNTNPKSISDGIKKMIENKKKWQTFSRNNLKEIKKYSWNKIVKQTENIYKEVINKNKKLHYNEIKSKK
jgi:glycosyltransferase involved in cell wall biosynthesis